MTERGPDAVGQLEVAADLRISVDGVDVRLTGEGQQLRLETDRPLALLRRVASSGATVPGGRTGLVTAAEVAAQHGLTLVATGPRGPALRVGADVSSAVARRVLGTAHVQLVVTRAQQLTLGAAGVAALVWWAGVRRAKATRPTGAPRTGVA